MDGLPILELETTLVRRRPLFTTHVRQSAVLMHLSERVCCFSSPVSQYIETKVYYGIHDCMRDKKITVKNSR